MELRELRSLVVLADTGTITRTAEQLHLSAAAIHNQLKNLENNMGIRLYRKVGRKLQLTQAAEMLLPQIRILLAQYDEITHSINDFKQEKRGSLRVGTGPTFSSHVLPYMLEEYIQRYSNVEIFVDAGQAPRLFESLNNEQLDAVIVVQSELSIPTHFTVQAMWDFELVIVSSISNHRRRCSLSALRDLPFILYKKSIFFESVIDEYFASYKFEPRVTMRFDNAEAIKAMIRSGLGISMLPMWTIDGDLKSKKVELIRQNEPPLYAKVVLVTRKQNRISPLLEAFINIVRTGDWRKKCQMTS